MMTILVFHAVTDIAWFDSLIGWLKKRYRIVPVEELAAYVANGRSSAPQCHITTDDGDESFARVMLPVLNKHGIHSSLFVSPTMCTEERNFWFQDIQHYDKPALTRIVADVLKVPVAALRQQRLEIIFKTLALHEIGMAFHKYDECYGNPRTAPQNISAATLQQIAATGLVSIGAHTVNHPILANEEDASSRFEISTSVNDLARLLGRTVEYFAYPNGIPELDFGEREEQFLVQNGIRMAFTTESRHLSPSDSRMRLPRIAISDKERLSRVAAKLCMGSHWNRMRRLRPNGEYAQRTRLRQIIDRYRCAECSAPACSRTS